jgi:lipopolysaccharide transport system ATP-binding protein
MPNGIAITCQGVSKSFALVDGGNAWRLAFGADTHMQHVPALCDVTFEVPKGQFVGILGRNGAGKSTLLRVLGGVYAPDTGSVSVSNAMSAIYELGLVGDPRLTGRAYAERVLTLHGFRKAERMEMIADIHEFSELGDRFDDPVLTYSAGMGARLFFSTATARRCDVYLLDEVLSVGDQHFQSKCWRRLRDRLSRGASGVLVTHDWAAILRMCETAHVLQSGRQIFSGPAEKAVRVYLYGEASQETFVEGVARFCDAPPPPIKAWPGADLIVRTQAEVLQDADVGCVFVIERLQPGFGWETALMSRDVSPVGRTIGRYDISVCVPSLPLEPGSYQISLHLVMPDPASPGRRIALDGWSWLNGNGLALEVAGDAGSGLTLPLSWQVQPVDVLAS